jgi:hypothetical protein
MVHRQTSTRNSAALYRFDRFPKLFGFDTGRTYTARLTVQLKQ